MGRMAAAHPAIKVREGGPGGIPPSHKHSLISPGSSERFGSGCKQPLVASEGFFHSEPALRVIPLTQG